MSVELPRKCLQISMDRSSPIICGLQSNKSYISKFADVHFFELSKLNKSIS